MKRSIPRNVELVAGLPQREACWDRSSKLVVRHVEDLNRLPPREANGRRQGATNCTAPSSEGLQRTEMSKGCRKCSSKVRVSVNIEQLHLQQIAHSSRQRAAQTIFRECQCLNVVLSVADDVCPFAIRKRGVTPSTVHNPIWATRSVVQRQEGIEFRCRGPFATSATRGSFQRCRSPLCYSCYHNSSQQHNTSNLQVHRAYFLMLYFSFVDGNN